MVDTPSQLLTAMEVNASSKPQAIVEGLAQSSSLEPTGFMRLPPELRLEVYHLCVPTKTIQMGVAPGSFWHQCVHDRSEDCLPHGYDLQRFNATRDWIENLRGKSLLRSSFRALRRVSRQIREEVLDLFYGNNLFVVTLIAEKYYPFLYGYVFPGSPLSYDNGHRIRHVMIAMQGHCKWPEDMATWNKVLPRLKSLWIVTAHEESQCFPLLRVVHVDQWEEMLEHMLDEWRAEWKQLHQWFAKALSSTASVLIDFSSKGNEKEVMQIYEPRDCREVHTTVGHLLYAEVRDEGW
jgi:hypothetical protein